MMSLSSCSTTTGARRAWIVPVALLVAACSGGPPESEALASVAIEPSGATLEITSHGGQTRQFKAVGTYNSGRTAPVAASWQVEDPLMGLISADGRFSATGTGGKTRIVARVGEQQAATDLTLYLKEALYEAGLSGADRGRLERQPLGDLKRAPAVIYPQSETMVPPNLPPILLQWTQGDATNQLFRAQLVCPTANVSWSTTKLSWQLPARIWSSLTNSCKGSKINLSLFGTGKASGALYLSGTTAINVADSPITGTIYYWATGKKGSNTNGIMRIDAGSSLSKDYYTQANNGSGRCPGCHAVSRDGSRIVFTEYDAKQNNWIYGLEVGSKKPYIPRDKLLGDFFTFAPLGNRMVSSQAGALTLRSGKDGAVIAAIPGWPGVKASHPDWSPVADELTFVLFPDSYSDDYQFCRGSITVMPIPSKGPWGYKTVVQSANANDHNYYPAFSPDGKQIAFNKVQTVSGEICALYANLKAKLYLVNRAGGKPVRLDRANGSGHVMDSWPKWAPSAPGSTIWWLAFSSVRDYGRVVENSKYPGLASGKHPQLWISAIDVSKLGQGDPSYPAFWLPGQNTTSGNHLPYWTKTLK
jgi:WD40-like Beta Propeller Repeat